jgi:hypothetical protein
LVKAGFGVIRTVKMEHQPYRDGGRFEPPRDEEPVQVVLDALDELATDDDPVVWEPHLRVQLTDLGLRRGRINAALRAAHARGHIVHMARRVVRCEDEATMRAAVVALAEDDNPPRRMIGELNKRIHQ